MGSARRTTLALCVTWALSGQAAAAGDAGSPTAMPVSQSTSHVLPAADDADTTADEGTAQPYQTLSTLGALALGIIGLLWVRRHTAEL